MDETLVSMISASRRRQSAGPVPLMVLTDHVSRLAGRERITFRAFVEAHRADRPAPSRWRFT
jgi:hypothetical protein